MVSSFSYLSLKQIDVAARVKYSYLGFVILPMLLMISVDPPTMLFAMFVSYATYGPVQWLVRKLRRPRSADACRPARYASGHCATRTWKRSASIAGYRGTRHPKSRRAGELPGEPRRCANQRVRGARAASMPAPLPPEPLHRLGCAARARRGLHGLRSLQDAHADGVRRGQHPRGVAGHRRGARAPRKTGRVNPSSAAPANCSTPCCWPSACRAKPCSSPTS